MCLLELKDLKRKTKTLVARIFHTQNFTLNTAKRKSRKEKCELEGECEGKKKKLTATAIRFFFLCARLDSNQHTIRHHPLKMACLPISPRARDFKTVTNIRICTAFQLLDL